MTRNQDLSNDPHDPIPLDTGDPQPGGIRPGPGTGHMPTEFRGGREPGQPVELPQEILATLVHDAIRTLEQATIALKQIMAVLRG